MDKVDEPVPWVVNSKLNLDKVKSTRTKSKGSGLNVLDPSLRKYLPSLPYPQNVIHDYLKGKCEHF